MYTYLPFAFPWCWLM